MPTQLRIPQRYIPGLAAIATLPEETIDELRDAFAKIPASLATDRLIDHAARSVPEVADNARQVTEALLSLIALLPEDGANANDLARDVANSIDLDIADDARTSLAQRLPMLLDVECLILAARAADLAAEHERAFHGARILTDVRPIFGRDAATGPRAAAVISTLKIDYHSRAGDVDSLFFGLDHADLVHLRDVVDRALAKHDGLDTLLERAQLPRWDYREVRDAPDA